MNKFAILLLLFVVLSSIGSVAISATVSSQVRCANLFAPMRTKVVAGRDVDARLYEELGGNRTDATDYRSLAWTSARMSYLGEIDVPTYSHFMKHGGFTGGADGHYALVAFAMVVKRQPNPEAVFKAVVKDGFPDRVGNIHVANDTRRPTLWYLHHFLFPNQFSDAAYNTWSDRVVRRAIIAWDKVEATGAK